MKPGSSRRAPTHALRSDQQSVIWLFGLHAVRDALSNPARVKRKLVATRNALDKLGADAVGATPLDLADPRKFPAPLDPGSVHQGAALQVEPLSWGSIDEVCAPSPDHPAPRVLLLDRVTDPHNVGAILRTAEVLGARAVIAPRRHAAPETGALAKSASGALERQPYLRVPNLARAMDALRELGYAMIGLDGDAPKTIAERVQRFGDGPLALALGAEGPGIRSLTRDKCDATARVPSTAGFGSLNVSNAAAIALYEATR